MELNQLKGISMRYVVCTVIIKLITIVIIILIVFLM